MILDDALLTAARTDTGAELRFGRSSETQRQLALLVAAENECCAKGGISWELIEDGGELVVLVAVPAELRTSPEVEVIYSFLSRTDRSQEP